MTQVADSRNRRKAACAICRVGRKNDCQSCWRCATGTLASGGRPEVCQLVAYNLTDITVKGSWLGPARLHLVPHVNAPVADLPVRKIVGAHQFVADVTLPYGRVLFDYNRER
jgi:hypothetical protein